jgi:S-DNA-T family DNA segregation ATPase FtsK/SpoIIIE
MKEIEELYKNALEVIKEEQKASKSLLQRRLMINYAKAEMLINMLEERGVIGKENGAKPRELIKES